MEKQLHGVRVELASEEERLHADCNLFLDKLGPPPHWHGRLWNVTPATRLKKGAKLTVTLPQGSTGELTIQRADARGAYDFLGEGLPPTF